MAESRGALSRFFRLLNAAGTVVLVGFLFCSGFIVTLFVSLMFGAGVWAFVWGLVGGVASAVSPFVLDDDHWLNDGGDGRDGDDGGILDVFDD